MTWSRRSRTAGLVDDDDVPPPELSQVYTTLQPAIPAPTTTARARFGIVPPGISRAP